MPIDLLKNIDLSHKLAQSLLVTIGILLSQIFDPFIGTLFVFALVVFVVPQIFPARDNLQCSAVVATLFVGLTPFYLILRGLFTRSFLNLLDLQIYSAVFFFGAIAINFLFNRNKPNSITQKFSYYRTVFLALGSLWTGLFVQVLLRNRSVGHAVAWAASGDSKNHLVNGVSITQYGFLDPTTFYTQPVSSPSFLALVLSQGGSELSTNTLLLEYQMQIYAFVWILLIGILGLTFSATAQIFWNKILNKKSEAPSLVILSVGLVPTFSFLMGSALFDGFFTAIFGISTTVLIMNWYLQQSDLKHFSISQIFIGLSIFVTSVLAWMFVAPLSLAVFIFGLRNNLIKLGFSKARISVTLLLIFVLSLVAIHFSQFGQQLIRNMKLALNTPGAANVNNPNYFYISLLALVFFGLLIRVNKKSFGNVIISISLIQLLVLISFKIFSNLNFLGWNYYLLKYQWIMFASVSAILIGACMYLLFSFKALTKPMNFMALFILISMFYIFSESIVSVNNVHKKIWDGWDNPRAVTMDKMLEQEIDNQIPTLFFHYGYAGESRMANFWLTAFANPIEPLKGWNYTIDTTGDPMQMCSVNYYYPALTIITSDYALEETLKMLCPEEKFIINLEPPLFPEP